MWVLLLVAVGAFFVVRLVWSLSRPGRKAR